jgi:hypothetical protein
VSIFGDTPAFGALQPALGLFGCILPAPARFHGALKN